MAGQIDTEDIFRECGHVAELGLIVTAVSYTHLTLPTT